MIDAFWYDKPVDAKLRTAALKALRTPTVCQTLRTYALSAFGHDYARTRAEETLGQTPYRTLKTLTFFAYMRSASNRHTEKPQKT